MLADVKGSTNIVVTMMMVMKSVMLKERMVKFWYTAYN